jgi:hypothetical protein
MRGWPQGSNLVCRMNVVSKCISTPKNKHCQQVTCPRYATTPHSVLICPINEAPEEIRRQTRWSKNSALSLLDTSLRNLCRSISGNSSNANAKEPEGL